MKLTASSGLAESWMLSTTITFLFRNPMAKHPLLVYTMWRSVADEEKVKK